MFQEIFIHLQLCPSSVALSNSDTRGLVNLNEEGTGEEQKSSGVLPEQLGFESKALPTS